MKPFPSAAAALMLLLGWSAVAGAEDGSKLDRALQQVAGTPGSSRVIVQTKSGEPADRLIRSVQGVPGRQLGLIGGQVADIPNQTLERLAGLPDVALVHLDRPAFPLLKRTGDAVGASFVRQQLGVDGAGVGIAIVDSGVTGWHDDLGGDNADPWAWPPAPAQRVAYFADFVNFTPYPYDDYGHGTHVAGVIAGNGYSSDGARTGLAPGAHLVALKVLDSKGHGYISDVISAIDHAIALKDAHNIRVINLSVGAGITESYELDPLAQATRRAVEAGIVVVAAAGNFGRAADGGPQYGGITAPGNAPWVLTVGAASHGGTVSRADDIVGGFSSRGPTAIDFAAKPDLVAPGVGLESLSDPNSAFYATRPEYLLSGTLPSWYLPYLSLTGTSMAAPVVSGAVALMLQANPDLTPNAIKAILQYTAEVHPGYDHLTQGAGFLNVRGAVRLAQFFGTPYATLESFTDDFPEGTASWSRHIIWGNYRLTGGLIMPGATAWADNIVWGTSHTPLGDNIVWGTACTDCENVVWGTGGAFDNIVWGTRSFDNIVWGTWDAYDNIVWGTWGGVDNIVWGTWGGFDNIVWGTSCDGADCQGIVWGAYFDNIVWGTWNGRDNIVWGTWNGRDNIVWGTLWDNVVWGVAWDDNIVWGTSQPPPPPAPAPEPEPEPPPPGHGDGKNKKK